MPGYPLNDEVQEKVNAFSEAVANVPVTVVALLESTDGSLYGVTVTFTTLDI